MPGTPVTTVTQGFPGWTDISFRLGTCVRNGRGRRGVMYFIVRISYLLLLYRSGVPHAISHHHPAFHQGAGRYPEQHPQVGGTETGRGLAGSDRWGQRDVATRSGGGHGGLPTDGEGV